MTNYQAFINNNLEGTPAKKTVEVKKASDAQKKFYTRLCTTHQIEPMENLDEASSSTISKLITKMNNAPIPASPGQVKAIASMIEELEGAGINMELVKDQQQGLTGGRDGTASTMITNLKKVQKESTHLLPPSQYQVDTLAGWFLCPDIPFEQYGIGKRFHIDKERGLWRFATEEEFKVIIHGAVTQQEASKLIGDHQSDFYEWSRNRATDNQKNMITTLELRMANIEVPKEVEYAVVDGIMTQITHTLSRQEYSPEAYVPMNETQLNLLSFEQAKKTIDMLQWELSQMSSLAPMDESVMQLVGDDQDELADKFTLGYSKSNLDLEFDRLETLYHQVKMVVGYEEEEVEHSLTDMVYEEKQESAVIEKKQRFKEYLLSSVTSEKDSDEWHKEMSRIFNMVQESESDTALEALTLQA